jgi:hypothetical protein
VYDLSGNRIREKTVQGGVAHQDNQLTYDAAGNRASDTYWGNKVRTVNGTSVIIGYDEDGKAIYSTTPTSYVREEGLVTEVYSYDNLNRLTGTVRDGTQVDLRYYDGAGRVVQSGPGAGLPSGYIARLNEGVPIPRCAAQAMGRQPGMQQRETREEQASSSRSGRHG